TKADVILAFFGYNESFGGEVGLGKFKSDLDSYLKHLLGKQYNGKSAPRVVLFSPIGHEDLHDRNLPDGAENNKRLALYTSAMAEAAKTNKVPFVDLYQPSRQLYAKTSRPLTVNGIHLNDYGNELLAKVIDQALFGNLPAVVRDVKQMEKLRQAIIE